MASEIRVNKINSRTGVGTITLSPTGVDFTGIATVATLKATTGIVTTLSVTGTTTLNGNLDLQDNDKILIGTGDDLEIYHNGSHNYIQGSDGQNIYIDVGDSLIIRNSVTNETSAKFVENGKVELRYDDAIKFETTGVGASVTGAFNVGSGTSITSSSLIVNDVQYPTVGPLSNRNLVINGAMRVAQRGTSSTSTGYLIDRFNIVFGQASITQSQQSLSSGSPYDEGFRYFHRSAVTTTSSANNAYLQIEQRIEAQNLAGSGWKYKDSSTNIIASFWARSSLAGTYYVQYRALDSASGLFYINKSFTLVADTWTKVEHVIPGNSNLVFNDDTGVGLQITIVPHYGTTYTDSSVAVGSWFTRSADNYFPDFAQNFTNTSSATFDVTGLQLEIGSKATPFEHRSFGDELARCQRYFNMLADNGYEPIANFQFFTTTAAYGVVQFPVRMRAKPSIYEQDVSNGIRLLADNTVTQLNGNAIGADSSRTSDKNIRLQITSGISESIGDAAWAELNNNNATIGFDAEL